MRYRKVTVRVPATTANLGPGYDCMGMALGLASTFSMERAGAFSIEITGAGAKRLSRGQDNLVWTSALRLYKAIGVKAPAVRLRCANAIPLNRGLGSSSSAIVGGLVAANALEGAPLDSEALLQLATEIEGHPDNVAPALLGGLQIVVTAESPSPLGLRSSSSPIEGEETRKSRSPEPRFSLGGREAKRGGSVVSISSPVRKGLKAVLFIPDLEVPTKKARAILPPTVSRADAVFNAGRTALLASAFAQGRWELLRIATQDRLHQPQRAAIIPGMTPLIQASLEAGAHGAFLSGAGPTILALASGETKGIEAAMAKAARGEGLGGSTRTAAIAVPGARVTQKE